MIWEANYGFLSLAPSLIAILLAILTRRVLLSLLLGLWTGYLIIAKGDPLSATLGMVEAIAATLASLSNTYTILFTLSIGGLVALLQYSGGVEGFLRYISAQLQRIPPRMSRSKLSQSMAIAMGMVLFIESNVSILMVGTLFRPLFDHIRVSREKLAYLCDSTSAPVCVLFPFNAWGAYILGILALNGFEDPLSVLLSSMVWNLYPILALLLLWATVIFGFELGGMRSLAKGTTSSGAPQVDAVKGTTSSGSPEAKKGLLYSPRVLKPRARNMILPLMLMLVLMPLLMVYTGWSLVDEPLHLWAHTDWNLVDKLLYLWAHMDWNLVDKLLHLWAHAQKAFLEGKGAFSVLMSSLFSLGFSLLWYRKQGICSWKEGFTQVEKGAMDMRTLAVLMLLAFTLGSLCKELQTGAYLASIIQGHVSSMWVPALFFVISGLISFSTGTSWGTFAVTLSLVLPVAEATGANTVLCVAASLGGGVFGDHCSPISDTTLIASLASGCRHISHVRTQLPYALLAGAITVLLYILLGFMI